ncbi:hypothetical protein Vretimale_8372, partial [Volvox reticuliferus]
RVAAWPFAPACKELASGDRPSGCGSTAPSGWAVCDRRMRARPVPEVLACCSSCRAGLPISLTLPLPPAGDSVTLHGMLRPGPHSLATPCRSIVYPLSEFVHLRAGNSSRAVSAVLASVASAQSFACGCVREFGSASAAGPDLAGWSPGGLAGGPWLGPAATRVGGRPSYKVGSLEFPEAYVARPRRLTEAWSGSRTATPSVCWCKRLAWIRRARALKSRELVG